MKINEKEVTGRTCILAGIELICLFSLLQGTAFARTGWSSDRLLVKNHIKAKMVYTDNIFLEEKEEQDEFITKVLPQILLSYALETDNIISAEYKGDYRNYLNNHNFKKIRNHGKIQWKWLRPGGSKFSTGAILDDSSIQPYSETGKAKDYLQWYLYAEAILKLGSFTESGLKLETKSRNFDEQKWEIDDYNRYGFTYHLGYQTWPSTSLIFKYNYFHQDNNELRGMSTDMDVHTVLFGPRWNAGSRLSGQFLVGYSKITGDNFTDNSGLSLNTDIKYIYSEFTTFSLTAYRQFNSSTRSARETNIYHTATGGSFITNYSRWNPLHFIFNLSYRNQNFAGFDLSSTEREDDYYKASIKAQYSFRPWLSLDLEYQYREKDSNFDAVEYDENRAILGVTFSL